MPSLPRSRTLALVCYVGFALSLARADEPKTLVFFGDSLTYGLGLDDPDSEAYPALIQEKITTAHLPWHVVNAGLSGDTTAGGLRRIDWVLQRPVDLLFLAEGGNDGLRGIAPTTTHENLLGIIAKVRAKNPKAGVVVAGIRMPDSLGPAYARAFAGTFPQVAQEENVALLPFLLEGVAGQPELNGPDGIHPNAAGHRIVAESVWRVLLPLLGPR